MRNHCLLYSYISDHSRDDHSLSYNNRPTSTNVLSKAFVHFSSFVLFVIIFIGKYNFGGYTSGKYTIDCTFLTSLWDHAIHPTICQLQLYQTVRWPSLYLVWSWFYSYSACFFDRHTEYVMWVSSTQVSIDIYIIGSVSAFVIRQATPDLSDNVCANDGTPGSLVLNEAT